MIYGLSDSQFAEFKSQTLKISSKLIQVNECITGEHNCHEYATCHDELFGFHCTCNDKYKDISENGDGTDCTHPYYTEDGECYLTEYSIFTDKKFERVSYGKQQKMKNNLKLRY